MHYGSRDAAIGAVTIRARAMPHRATGPGAAEVHEVSGGRLARQGDRRQGKSPAALSEGDVLGADLADLHKGHQREDLSPYQGQDRGGAAAQLRWRHQHHWGRRSQIGQPSMSYCHAGLRLCSQEKTTGQETLHQQHQCEILKP